MSLATGTGTDAEIVALYVAVAKLEVMLRQHYDGSALYTKPGRFAFADIDTAITAVSDAITAVNA
jgi:hypothetical protein